MRWIPCSITGNNTFHRDMKVSSGNQSNKGTMSLTVAELRKGDKESGDCGYSPLVPPDWLDHDKFERGREFFLQHIGAVMFSCHCSLAVGLSLENLLVPLMFTGKSDTPEKSYKRYYKTFLHIALWHMGDVWDPHSMAHKSVQKVRAMHGSVARRLHAAYPESDKVHISQFDMVIVQFGFFAASVQYPKGFGIKCTREERADYVYFWRGIGYLLGIDDKYNICRGTLDETLQVCEELERKVVIPALRDPPKDFDRMAYAYIQLTNLQMNLESMTKEAILAFFMDISGLMEPPRMTIADGCRFWLLKFTAFMLRWCPGIEWLVNAVIFKMFHHDIGKLKL